MSEPEKKVYRSVSQLQQYERCPHAYYLARIEKAWKRPAAWLAQGSAVHEALEARERSGRTMTLEETQDSFRESYAKHINEATAITPNLEFWFRSGPYDGAKDIERRYGLGLDQVVRYFEWTDAHPDEVIWISEDGTPGIELEFDFDLDGIWIRGFIDQVLKVGDEYVVRDLKMGSKVPQDDFQLGVYGLAIKELYGIEASVADYWMGKSGKPTYPYDISDWTREVVSEKFRELEDNIQAGRFDPNPDPDRCNFCDVASSCNYVAG